MEMVAVNRVRWAAAAWAFLFAGVSFYWALGGQAGAGTVGTWAEQAAAQRDPEMTLVLWSTGLLKALLGVLPLALARGWFRFLTRRLLRLAAGAAGAAIGLYYLANLVQHLLIWSGTLPLPASLGRRGLVGHLLLWDPWWILGGVLLLLSARSGSAEGKT